MAGNAGPGDSKSSTAEDYAALERLPIELKQILWNFAYPLDASGLYKAARGFGALDSNNYLAIVNFEEKNREFLQRFRDHLTSKFWGEDHPNYGEPLNEDWT